MTPKTLAAAVFAVTVVLAGTAAAVPAIDAADGVEGVQSGNHDGATPAPGGGDDPDRGNESDHRDGESVEPGPTERDDAPGRDDSASDRRGPPTDLPDPVPGFLTDVHDQVRQFLAGSVQDLGSANSSVTPGDGDDPAGGANETTADERRSDDTTPTGDDRTGANASDEERTDWSQSADDDRDRSSRQSGTDAAVAASAGPPA